MRIGILPSLKLETQHTNENLVWNPLEAPRFSCIYWVIKSSHMVVFCPICSCFSSMFLSGSLFSGWLKFYLYWQLSVFCNCPVDDPIWRVSFSFSSCHSLFVNLTGKAELFFVCLFVLFCFVAIDFWKY